MSSRKNTHETYLLTWRSSAPWTSAFSLSDWSGSQARVKNEWEGGEAGTVGTNNSDAVYTVWSWRREGEASSFRRMRQMRWFCLFIQGQIFHCDRWCVQKPAELVERGLIPEYETKSSAGEKMGKIYVVDVCCFCLLACLRGGLTSFWGLTSHPLCPVLVK